MAEPNPMHELLVAAEVADMFGVGEGTVKVWARNDPGWIGAIRTPGGQWRFRSQRVLWALKEDRRARPRAY